MIDRIKSIMKHKNLSASTFALEIGVQRSAISHVLSGRNNPSLDFVQKILSRYPDYNSDWIISGNGAMLKNELSLFEVENTLNEISVNSELENNIISEQPKYIRSEKKLLKEKTQPIKTTSELAPEISKTKKIERIVIFYADKTFTEYIS